MRIIKQSFEILKDIDDKVKQIGSRSRICYKSEQKETETEVGFVNGIIKAGHNSCLEMAAINLILEFNGSSLNDKQLQSVISMIYRFKENNYRFVKFEGCGVNKYIITSTIRGFRELYKNYKHLDLVKEIFNVLYNKYLILFEDLIDDSYIPKDISKLIKICNIDTEIITTDIYKRHKFQGVKIITNRAVTHELVRHRPVTFLQESQRYCSYNKDQFGKEVTFIDPRPAFNFNDLDYAKWLSAMQFCEYAYMDLLKNNTPQAARTVMPNSCKTEIIVYCELEQWEHIFFMRAINPKAEPSMRECMIPIHEKFKELYPGFFDNPKIKIG